MSTFTRRQWLAGLTGAGLARAQKTPVSITDYEPKSMLHVPEHTVARSKFPVIDIHTHLTMVDTLTLHPKVDLLNTSPEEILPVMDRKHIRMMVNLTGGCGPALEEVIQYWHLAKPQRVH